MDPRVQFLGVNSIKFNKYFQTDADCYGLRVIAADVVDMRNTAKARSSIPADTHSYYEPKIMAQRDASPLQRRKAVRLS